MITATSGQAVMSHRFIKYDDYKGEIPGRINGSMISKETGEAIAYSLDKLQDRGKFFIEPGDEIYTGMVVGENSRGDDLVINCTVTKKLTNVRASGSDDKVRLAPPIKFTLEEALEYIQGDELVELTPKSIRIRKIYLDENERKRKTGK
jgi:GTP-binding protein